MTRVAAPTHQRASTPRALYATARAGAIPRVILSRPETWTLLLATFALLAIGLAAINITGGVEPGVVSSLAKKQLLLVGVGAFAGATLVVPHYRIFADLSWLAALLAVGLLLFLLIPFVPSSIVRPINGARAWINLGPFGLQPAEFAKIAFVVLMASYLRQRKTYRSFKGLIPPALITFVPVVLILLQPDMGTAMLFLPVLVAMLIAAGAKLKHFIIIGALGLALAPLSYPFLLPHQKERITALIHQYQGDTTTADSTQFQTRKAMELIGAGGVGGVPEAKSRALVRYNALPEAHNDMIFSVIVNRFGLLGATGVFGLYLLWIASALAIAARCREPFGRIVAVGVATFVPLQAAINMGVCTGILPVVGITLPFLSYGGSSAIALLMGVGLLVNISIRPPRQMQRASFEFDDDDEP
ncbi:MAG: FtsW/RodA/SpoVE family cell cycle protein [Phycisphaerales bacterium]